MVKPSVFAGISMVGLLIASIVLGILWQAKRDAIPGKLKRDDKAGAQQLKQEAATYGTASFVCALGTCLSIIVMNLLRWYGH